MDNAILIFEIGLERYDGDYALAVSISGKSETVPRVDLFAFNTY